jgi:hypothetical protein
MHARTGRPPIVTAQYPFLQSYASILLDHGILLDPGAQRPVVETSRAGCLQSWIYNTCKAAPLVKISEPYVIGDD